MSFDNIIYLNPDSLRNQINDEMLVMGRREANRLLVPHQIDLKKLCRQPGVQDGEPLPWRNDIIYLREKELSIWAGINGHGKSLLVDQVALWRCQNQRVIIASMEMTPEQSLYRMINQLVGCAVAEKYLDLVCKKLYGRMWIYNELDHVESQRILALCHYVARVLQVHHIVIDSLSTCGLSLDDWNGQQKFIQQLQYIAKKFGPHIHLVCHIRKKDDENKIPNKFDIRGHGSLADIADNVFIVWRNKPRERLKHLMQRENIAESQLDPRQRKILEAPGTWLLVEKNRHGGQEGWIPLYMHSSGQYSQIEGRTLREPF